MVLTLRNGRVTLASSKMVDENIHEILLEWMNEVSSDYKLEKSRTDRLYLHSCLTVMEAINIILNE